MAIRMESAITALANDYVVFVQATFAYWADVVSEALSDFFLFLLLLQTFRGRLWAMLFTVNNEPRIHKEAIWILGAHVMVGSKAILDKAAEAPALLLAESALDLVAPTNALAEVFELVLIIQENFWGP
jgi:hypothetical protein